MASLLSTSTSSRSFKHIFRQALSPTFAQHTQILRSIDRIYTTSPSFPSIYPAHHAQLQSLHTAVAKAHNGTKILYEMFKKKHFDGWGGRSAEPKLDREGWEKVREMVGYLERLRGMVDVEIVQFLRAFREAGGRGMGSFTPRVLGEKVVNLEGLAKVVVWLTTGRNILELDVECMNASIVKERDKLPGLTEENWEGCAGRLIGWEEEMKKGVKVWYVFEDEGGTRAGHLLPTRNRGLFESRSYGGGQIREL